MECRLRKCGTPTARPGSATSASAALNGTPFSGSGALGTSDGSAHGGSQNGSVHCGAAAGPAQAVAASSGGLGAGGPAPAANGGAMSGEKTSHSLWLYTRKFVRLLLTKAVSAVVDSSTCCVQLFCSALSEKTSAAWSSLVAERCFCGVVQQGPISLAEAAHQLMGDVPDAKRAQTQVTAQLPAGLGGPPLLT